MVEFYKQTPLKLWSYPLSPLAPNCCLVEISLAKSSINFSCFQTLLHLWRQTVLYYKIKCHRLCRCKHNETWCRHRNRINRIFHLQRSSNERPSKNFKTVPCMPMCVVTGHISVFGRRSVQTAFSPATSRNWIKGSYFSCQAQFQLLWGSPLLLYLKGRETWCHKLTPPSTGSKKTSVLQANPQERLNFQHGISSVQWFLRASEPQLPPWWSSAPTWSETLLAPGKAVLEAEANSWQRN